MAPSEEKSEDRGPKRAVFLDRDGTIIEHVPYLSSPDQVRLIDGAASALKAISAAGHPLIVVSNQSGIGRGFYTESDAALVTARMEELLAGRGVTLDCVLHCPHTPDDRCECRKPSPGMANQAAQESRITLAGSIMIGDNCSDMDFGRAFGATNILVMTGLGKECQGACEDSYDFVVRSIADSTEIVFSQ